MAPDLPTSGFSVSPGDTIQASVRYDTSASEFDFVVDDMTSGHSLTQSIACQSDHSGCVRSSAEVISEDALGGDDVDGLYFLPAYNSVSYSNVSITDAGGHTGTLTDPVWVANDVTQVSSQLSPDRLYWPRWLVPEWPSARLGGRVVWRRALSIQRTRTAAKSRFLPGGAFGSNPLQAGYKMSPGGHRKRRLRIVERAPWQYWSPGRKAES